MLGIYIHNLKDPNTGKCNKGVNPFNQFIFKDKNGTIKIIPVKNPLVNDAYNDIRNNLEDWVEEAINNIK